MSISSSIISRRREALQSAFEELGIQETDLFITHLHSDHCGLIGKFARENSTIYAGETDGELINFETGNLYWRMLDDLFIKYGFPKATFGRNTDIHPGRKYCQDTRVNFTYAINPEDLVQRKHNYAIVDEVDSVSVSYTHLDVYKRQPFMLLIY